MSMYFVPKGQAALIIEKTRMADRLAFGADQYINELVSCSQTAPAHLAEQFAIQLDAVFVLLERIGFTLTPTQQKIYDDYFGDDEDSEELVKQFQAMGFDVEKYEQ